MQEYGWHIRTSSYPTSTFLLQLRYTNIEKKFFEAKTRKKQNCDIPNTIPEFYHSFVAKALESEINGLVERMEQFFAKDECVVIAETCTTTPPSEISNLESSYKI